MTEKTVNQRFVIEFDLLAVKKYIEDIHYAAEHGGPKVSEKDSNESEFIRSVLLHVANLIKPGKAAGWVGINIISDAEPSTAYYFKEPLYTVRRITGSAEPETPVTHSMF